MITYAYDGLQRLTGVTESPGTTYAYSYDDAGNRTGVWLNGTRTVTQTFNAANQVDGLSYDAAGNLTGDGTTTYGYDALGRMTIRNTTPYTYNGDGALVFDGISRYTQDLASPLTQVLQTTQGSATTNELYGLERLAAQSGSAKTWYVGDVLGSVRLTLDDAGAPLGVVTYDPWGSVESGAVPTFGFTGELQDSAAGLVNLRARWYATGQGRFVSRDPFAGVMEQPQTLAQYPYAENDPANKIDPSGNLGLFVFGGPNDTTSYYKLFSGVPTEQKQYGFYQMTAELAPFVPGQSYYSAPLATGDGADNYAVWIAACAARERDEPIVLVGYSRGAASVHLLAEALARKDIRVALLVEIALIPGQINLHGNTGNWEERPWNVDHLLSYRSEEGYLSIGPFWLNEHIDLQSDNTIRVVPNSDHGSISWPSFRSRCLTTEDQENPRLCKRMISQAGRAQVVWYSPVPPLDVVQPPYPIRNPLIDEVKSYLIKTFAR